jgi:ribosomal protein L34
MTVSGGLASKPAVTVFAGLASKSVAMVFSSLASKLVATFSLGLASKLVVGFLVEPQNQGGGGFPGLGLKTGSFSLVIYASKSPRWFLGLSLKTKRASVYRLRHKTDGGRSVWDTRRDLAAYFTWKQVWFGFSSPA